MLYLEEVIDHYQTPVWSMFETPGGKLLGRISKRGCFKEGFYAEPGLKPFRDIIEKHFDDVEFLDEDMNIGGTEEGVLLTRIDKNQKLPGWE